MTKRTRGTYRSPPTVPAAIIAQRKEKSQTKDLRPSQSRHLPKLSSGSGLHYFNSIKMNHLLQKLVLVVLRISINAGFAIYPSHLPLDAHTVGTHTYSLNGVTSLSGIHYLTTGQRRSLCPTQSIWYFLVNLSIAKTLCFWLAHSASGQPQQHRDARSTDLVDTRKWSEDQKKKETPKRRTSRKLSFRVTLL